MKNSFFLNLVEVISIIILTWNDSVREYTEFWTPSLVYNRAPVTQELQSKLSYLSPTEQKHLINSSVDTQKTEFFSFKYVCIVLLIILFEVISKRTNISNINPRGQVYVNNYIKVNPQSQLKFLLSMFIIH